MLELLVLRHAQAVDHAVSDFARSLTEKGMAQAQAVGAFCGAHGLVPDIILSSPVTRAHQTAEIAKAAMRRSVRLDVTKRLSCGAQPEEIFDLLREIQEEVEAGRIMIIGHQPDLGEFMASAIGARSGSLMVKKASLACLEMASLRAGASSLRFQLPVQFMKL